MARVQAVKALEQLDEHAYARGSGSSGATVPGFTIVITRLRQCRVMLRAASDWAHVLAVFH
jgi:hypothetical protein